MSITSTGASDYERKLQHPRKRAVGYTVGEVAQMLRVNKNCVYEMVARGDIVSVKIGRLVRIPARPFHEKFGEVNPSGEEEEDPSPKKERGSLAEWFARRRSPCDLAFPNSRIYRCHLTIFAKKSTPIPTGLWFWTSSLDRFVPLTKRFVPPAKLSG